MSQNNKDHKIDLSAAYEEAVARDKQARKEELLAAIEFGEKQDAAKAAMKSPNCKLMASGYDLQLKHPDLAKIYKESGNDFDEVVHVPILDRWFARNFHTISEFVFKANGEIEMVEVGQGDKNRKEFIVSEDSRFEAFRSGDFVKIPDTWEKYGCYDGCEEWIEILLQREIAEKQTNDLILNDEE